MSESIALPPSRLCIAITGHRDGNIAFAQNRAAIEAAMAQVFDAVDAVVTRQDGAMAATRLHSLLAQGADMIAVEQVLARNWEVVAPLPFGLDLTIAINVDGDEERAAQMRAIAARATLFELAEQDTEVGELRRLALTAPDDIVAQAHYHTIIAERVAAAGRILIEQSDLLIAIWDGVTPGAMGGTRHTISAALKSGAPVIWIDASRPGNIACLRVPEELFALDDLPQMTGPELDALLQNIVDPPEADQNEREVHFHTEQWHARSYRRFHAYRRVEALFGGKGAREKIGSLTRHYESPAEIATGSGMAILETARTLPGAAPAFAARIEAEILRRFAWADGLSTHLSDAYRGGMMANFLLSAAAIIIGIAYLPFASIDTKWPFALGEFLLLVAIIAITTIGRRHRWHGRWFQMRRVAEYLRHAPIMLLLGVARSPGRWPRGADTEWPEHYAKAVLRDIGLPHVAVTQDYLRMALRDLFLPHAEQQRVYHEAKAVRLTRVHHGLDLVSEWLFALAVLTVASYLALVTLETFHLISEEFVHKLSKTFTFFGVILPALGATCSGIRYFGDFERFAAISEITAEKLASATARITTLLAIPEGRLRYAQIADLAHVIDETVISEIENWQSVFGGKQIAVPV